MPKTKEQEMVYHVLTPFSTMGLPPTETFVWTQAQWVGIPLNEMFRTFRTLQTDLFRALLWNGL